MKDELSDITKEQQHKLAVLIQGMKNLNLLSKVETYSVTEKEIIIGVKKKVGILNDAEMKQQRKLIISEIKKVFKPYIGLRKIHVQIKFI